MDILILEDDHPIADFIAEALRDEGYQPRVAYSVSAAIAAIQDGIPQLILLDLNIPTASDSALFLEHCRNSVAHLVPIVVITAASRLPSAEILGVTDFLVKPFELNDLFACVKHHIGDPSSPDSPLPAL